MFPQLSQHKYVSYDVLHNTFRTWDRDDKISHLNSSGFVHLNLRLYFRPLQNKIDNFLLSQHLGNFAGNIYLRQSLDVCWRIIKLSRPKCLILIGPATPCHMKSDQQLRENVFFLEPKDKRRSLVAGYILMIALAGIYGRPYREHEKKYLDSKTIMILFCQLVEIYLLFDYSYFPICFATIFSIYVAAPQNKLPLQRY